MGASLYRWSNVSYPLPHLPTLVNRAHSAMASKIDDWIIIGISGVTCGGKTTLANKLKQAITPVYLFHQDKYFLPDNSPKHVRCNGIDHNNYDILSALDMDKMYNDILSTIKGENRSQETSLEKQNRYEIPGTSFMVIDGFTALNFKPIFDLCHLKYYFVLEYGECLSRRVFRVYDPPDVPGYFEHCVWPEHLKYRAEIESNLSVRVLDGKFPDNFDIVMADIKAYAKRP